MTPDIVYEILIVHMNLGSSSELSIYLPPRKDIPFELPPSRGRILLTILCENVQFTLPIYLNLVSKISIHLNISQLIPSISPQIAMYSRVYGTNKAVRSVTQEAVDDNSRCDWSDPVILPSSTGRSSPCNFYFLFPFFSIPSLHLHLFNPFFCPFITSRLSRWSFSFSLFIN